MSSKKRFTQELANAFVASNWTLDDLLKRLETSLGFSPVWGKLLLNSIYHKFKDQYPYVKPKELSVFIDEHPLFQDVWKKHRHTLIIRSYNLELPIASPAILNCDVPQLKTIKDLADWFDITPQRLEGFADVCGFERKTAALHQRHYHYIWKKKQFGADRLLEIPKTNLRAMQRQINTEILQRVPLHSACHGFRQEHSCLTYVQVHCNKVVVIRIDLQRFFTSIPLRRIHAIFETIDYRPELARLFAGICSNHVPHDVLQANSKLTWQERKQYANPHLSQGAPSSPALANLAAFKLDTRLSALIKEIGGEYTRYADDLAFSGNFSEAFVSRLLTLVNQIIMEEGFSMNSRKTRVMRRDARQQLTGLVLNQHANYPRYKYDQLKAILYNCSCFGAASQNRRGHENFKAHLQGKIAHVKSINPQRAVRLEQLFDKIDWERPIG